MPIRFASQIHSNLHKLLQSRKIAAGPRGGGGAAATARQRCRQRCGQRAGRYRGLRAGGTAGAMAMVGIPVPGGEGSGHGLAGAAGGVWVVWGV